MSSYNWFLNCQVNMALEYFHQAISSTNGELPLVRSKEQGLLHFLEKYCRHLLEKWILKLLCFYDDSRNQ